MGHVEEEIILVQLYGVTVIVELRHTLSAEHHEPVVFEYELSVGQMAEVLHDHQLVVAFDAQGVVAMSR